MAVGACPYVRGRTCKQTKKLSNRVPETTTTQAVLSFSRARTCVAVHAKNKNKKNFQTASQKRQPHRPFLRSRVLATTTLPHTELIKVQIKIKFTSLSLLAMTFAAM